MRKYFILILFCVISVQSLSQDQLFSQNDLNLLYTNPAFAGYYQETRILLLHREQWTSINGSPYNSEYGEINFKIGSGKKSLTGAESALAMGVHISTDYRDIVFKTQELGISISGISKVNRYFVHQAGLGFSLKHGSLDKNKLIFGDQINYYNNNVAGLDPQNEPPIDNYSSYPNPGIGYIASFRIGKRERKKKRWTSIGFSAMNIFKNVNKKSYNNSEYNINPPRYYSYINHKEPINLEKTIKSLKHINIFSRHMRQIERLDRWEFGCNIMFKGKNWGISPGFIWRKSDAYDNRFMQESYIGAIKYEFKNKNNKKWSFNYSYDLNRSELTHISAGSTHEIGIALHLGRKNKSICAGVCPADGESWDDW